MHMAVSTVIETDSFQNSSLSRRDPKPFGITDHMEQEVRFELTRTKSAAYKTAPIGHYGIPAYVAGINFTSFELITASILSTSKVSMIFLPITTHLLRIIA